jgi:carboxylesterase type B
VARWLTAHEDQPAVYAYQFLWGAEDEYGNSVLPETLLGFLPSSKIGACHAIDIPFFLASDTAGLGLLLGLYTEANRVSREALTDAIMIYQANFIWTGDPNDSGSPLPEWEPWSNGTAEPKCILLDADIEGNLRLQMSTVELTVEGLREKFDTEVPEPLHSEAAPFLEEWSRL